MKKPLSEFQGSNAHLVPEIVRLKMEGRSNSQIWRLLHHKQIYQEVDKTIVYLQVNYEVPWKPHRINPATMTPKDVYEETERNRYWGDV